MWHAFPAISNLFFQSQEASGVIFQSLQVLNIDDAAMFCCIIWSIWKQRNNKIWKEVIDAQTFVFDRAKVLLEDWKSAKLVQETSPNRQQQDRSVKWVKPSAGRFKCNIDAFFLRV
jgi:hypothetical protein